MRKIISLIYILVLLAITGCGRKEVDYNITDEVVGNQEGQIGNLYEKLGAENYWETQIYDGEEKYDIKATVTIPEVSSLNVYSATANIYSAEEREKLINYLTDDNDNISEAQYDYMAYEHIIKHNNMDYVLRFRDSSPEYGAVEGGFDFGVSESYWWNDEKAGGFVFGLYDNTLLVEDSPYSEIKLALEDKKVTEENICVTSKEDAMYVARDFVDGLSVGDFYVADSYSLGMIGTFRDADGKTDKWYDGYVFVFYRFIDEVEVEGNSYLSCMEHTYSKRASLDQDFGYGFEQITVCVNDIGVIYASYRHPLEIEEVMAEDVPLLSYEQIIGILEYEVPRLHGRYICFNNLELKYFRVKDESTDGSYAIVPTWQLTKEKDESISYYTVINAIDGSVIYVVEEIYDIEYDTEESGVVIN